MLIDKRLKSHRIDRPRKVALKDFDPSAKPLSAGNKAADKERIVDIAKELARLQDNFYALRKDKLLLVLQGMDTSGKDGTIRAVFQAIDPLGVRAVSYRAPTAFEADRDFLWRHHRDVPGKGEIVIFNRSHYEAVLIEYVRGWIDAAERERRFARIVDFERLLADTGTTIVKCFLHISSKEQRKRLQERIDDPSKHWKFNPQDLEERKRWRRYQDAYEAVLQNTATAHAPWYVVPADSKTHRNLMVGTILLETLRR
ncbi:MAG: polyphosphate kinase 2 family protein, partial [Burkholderiaceae bacterium]|nr:polyphosphate kinase 2 family protein [Burkholderiaceae bacterium]